MSSNPFIVEDGGNPVQSTVSRVQQSLSLFRNILSSPHAENIELDFDQCSALLFVLDGMNKALMDAVEKLDDYEPKAKSPTD